MTGYVQCLGECVLCRRLFTFHPSRVPSVVQDGKREPLCESCLAHVNKMRERKGLLAVVPLSGAYEAAPENEVDWDG